VTIETLSLLTLPNGLTVILDPMPEVNSVAYSLTLPGGICGDPENEIGQSLLLADSLSKGAGPLDARALINQFDFLAISHAEYSSSNSFTLQGVCVADKLSEALKLLGLLVTEAHLPEEYIAPVRSVLLQDIESLTDNPSRWCLVELGMRYYPIPYNRSSLGTTAGLNAITKESIHKRYKDAFCPQGSVLSIAGRFNPKTVVQVIEELFSNWKGTGEIPPQFNAIQPFANHFIEKESAQTQIAFAFPSAKFNDPDYYAARLAHQILSGGMFGRLFLEVREKKGLCYSVYARHAATKDYGVSLVYAGTTPERASITLETIKNEFSRVDSTLEQTELDRARANLKSSLLLSEDSSGARAVSNGNDWWLGGRVRPLAEIEAEINAVTIDDIKAYFHRYPTDPATQLVVGPAAL
jgi:predicted Zn-dependent peptidase